MDIKKIINLPQSDRSLAKVLAGHVIDEHFDPDTHPDMAEIREDAMAAAEMSALLLIERMREKQGGD